MASDLQPLARGELAVGLPVPYAIYDRRGQLLLAAGQSVQTEDQLNALYLVGLFRNPRWTQEAAEVQARLAAADATSSKPAIEPLSRSQAISATDDTIGRHVLKMSTASGANEYAVRLIGVNPENSVIVSAPTLDGKLIFVKEGQSYNFKGFFGQSILSFSASIIKVQFSPYPYLHLAWPDATKISRRPLRHARRARCRLPTVAYFKVAGSERQVHGFVSDLSTGGAELWVPEELPQTVDNLMVAFKVQVSTHRELVEVGVASLRLKLEKRNMKGAHYGIEFDELGSTAKLAIHAYIHELLVVQLESPFVL